MPRLLAAIYDSLMRATEEACLAEWRARLLGGLRGRVLEIGAGTGANLPHYPATVDELVLCEPDRFMRNRLAARAGGARVVDAAAEQLPFPDGSFDCAVSTLVLCSVADPDRALAELHRVVKPGGKLVFLEHVAAEEGTRRRKWQGRIDPIWWRLMANCHLARDTASAITRAGFRMVDVQRESMRKAMPLVRPTVRGIAVRA